MENFTTDGIEFTEEVASEDISDDSLRNSEPDSEEITDEIETVTDGTTEDVIEDVAEDFTEDVTAILPIADEETLEDNIDYTDELELRNGLKIKRLFSGIACAGQPSSVTYRAI